MSPEIRYNEFPLYIGGMYKYNYERKRVYYFRRLSGVGFELPTHLINFRVTFVRFCPILGHFGRELLGRCSLKFAIAT